MEVISGVRVAIVRHEKCPSLWRLSSPDMGNLYMLGASPEQLLGDAPAMIDALRGAST